MKPNLPLGKTATITGAAALRADIAAALSTGAAITLDAASLVDVDLSFVQLIEAARREAAARGVELTLAQPANDCLAAVLERTGVTTAAAADRSFWFHGKERA